MPSPVRFYLTTAIDYVNSRPHLGTAYEKVCADVIARYKRLCGIDTFFLMGNDEHSQNVYRKARELGLEPHAYCDQMEHEFTRTWRHLQVSFDGGQNFTSAGRCDSTTRWSWAKITRSNSCMTLSGWSRL